MLGDVPLAAIASGNNVVNIYAHRGQMWDPLFLGIGNTNHAIDDGFQITTRAGLTYLVYWTGTRVKLIALDIP
jgi:hypothetical protein